MKTAPVQKLSKCQSGTTTASAFSLPRQCQKSIVDVVLNIMNEDGPQPMRGMKPAQKTPNGADNFYEEHHGKYEARGARSQDRVARVHQHNSGYPKLLDELDKRRSTSKPIAVANRSTSYAHTPRRCHCSKFKKDSESKRKHNNRLYDDSNRTRSRVIKHRPKTSRMPSPAKYRLYKFKTNKSCQCRYTPCENKGICTCQLKITDATTCDEKMVENLYSGNVRIDKLDSNTSVRYHGDSKSEIGGTNPGTSDPSITSYNSYMSMDHEPMVSP